MFSTYINVIVEKLVNDINQFNVINIGIINGIRIDLY